MRLSVSDVRELPAGDEWPDTEPAIIHRNFPYDLWELVQNRMVVGRMNYGHGKSKWHEPVMRMSTHRLIVSMHSKFLQFLWTRNLEYLVDVVTYACMIWRWGEDSRLHFKSTERHDAVELRSAADAASMEYICVVDKRWNSCGIETYH